jgi:RNA polymerase-binding protein DksA
MKPWQRDELRRALERRRESLLEELRRDAQRARDERFAELAGPVHDTGDESIAALLSDLDEAELSRDLVELREVEEARKRLAAGSYGICADCGAAIPYERLLYQPAAARCIDCQAQHEKTYRR